MPKEQYILGINGFPTGLHSASASLIKNGELVAMVEQDRFSRKKNAFGEIPHDAIAFCLDSEKVGLDDIDVVGLGYDFNLLLEGSALKPLTAAELINLYFPKDKFRYSKNPRVEMVTHHLAHACSTYFSSGFEDAAILVVDGQGEKQSTSFYHGQKDRVICLAEFPVEYSLGYFYNAVSRFIGFGHMDPGKAMGLAAYGSPIYAFAPFSKDVDGYSVNLPFETREDGNQKWREVVTVWREYLKEKFGSPNDATYEYHSDQGKLAKRFLLGQKEKDLAASAQWQLEDIVLHLLTVLKSKSRSENLCLAGGVSLNCSMNGRIMREGLFQDLFIPPFVDDAGVSLGAALYLSDKKPRKRLGHAYYGPSFNNEQIQKVLSRLGISYEFYDDIAKITAELLSKGQIVSWFQGKIEIGPRALGNRSILADPTNLQSNIQANGVKNREPWRPLAPSFLAERMGEYVEGNTDSPFMIKAYHVKSDQRANIPAVVHVDGTLRPQSVDRQTNHLYHQLITEFETRTGVPAVLNTSFNLDSEPIVLTPYDAVRSFFSSSSNNLVMGNFLIRKNTL